MFAIDLIFKIVLIFKIMKNCNPNFQKLNQSDM